MTKSRRSRLGIGALMIGIPASAAAIAAGQALASPVPVPTPIQPQTRHIAYGRDVIVRGSAPASDAGHSVALEYAQRGATVWSQLGSTTVGSAGAFRLAAPLEHSGLVRVLDTTSGSLTPFAASSTGGEGGAATSTPVPVYVAAGVRVRSHPINVLAGQAVLVRGRLVPGARGRKVSLQALQSGSWHTLTTSRTRSAGQFVLRYVTGSAGQQRIRVRFAGDQLNGRSTAGAGRMTVYRLAEASWYNDGGNTACGFHADYGVANRTLPCGTTVAFRYGGRSVTATVDDRGPYVGGRDWDLNQNTASALGFGGVGQVWSSQ
jgi:rare lipoprotein A